jgi:hypothetical protein
MSPLLHGSTLNLEAAQALYTNILVILLLMQADEDPLAEGLETDADTRLWVRLMQSLNIQADKDESYASIFTPTDRVS